MDSNYTYFRISGLAYSKGIDNFEDIMPKKRMDSLFKAYIETKGNLFSSTLEDDFCLFILAILGREDKNYPQVPVCNSDCKYHMKYAALGLQRNALRVEIFEPQDRCGWNIIDGRLGGRPDDYHPCPHHNKTKV